MKNGKLVGIVCIVGIILNSLAACRIKSVQTEKIQTAWKQHVVPGLAVNNRPPQKAKCFKVTTYDGIDYNFKEDVFEEATAKEFIEKESVLVKYADKILGKRRDGTDIYVNEWMDGEKVNIENGITFDALWTGLNRVHKATGLEQYGLFYLYCESNHLIAVEDEKVSDDAIAAFFSEKKNMFLLDFCVPMMDARIFNAEQVRMTKAAVKAFSMWYMKQKSLEAYEKLSGNWESAEPNELEEAKNAWLKSIDCKVNYKEFSKIAYKPCNRGWEDMHGDRNIYQADYEIERNDAIWCFYNRDFKKLGYKEMVRNYNRMEPKREKDFEEAREFLEDYLPAEMKKVEIYADFQNTASANGFEMPSKNAIVLGVSWMSAMGCLLHEYVHYLTMSKDCILDMSYSRFCYEGVAEWVANMALENREHVLFQKMLVKSERKHGERVAYDPVKDDIKYGSLEGFLQCAKDEDSKDSKRKPPKGLPYAVDIDSMY
ncbi:MAG: hypothetical protein E7277_09920, partial [Lachnospiraceae bacterium]|nr:hypothetical protein [Lachnospiraceae bacterium]